MRSINLIEEQRLNNVYMKKALALAHRVGMTSLPNPQVGAIIVKNNRIVGSGYTQKYGGLHAEALAIADAGKHVSGSTLYCSLEPCVGTWKGKNQPSCAKAIVEAKIKEVYVGCLDYNVKVHGKGIAYLKNNGIIVHHLSQWQEPIARINEVCIHLLHKKIPFVELKVGQSLEGFMAPYNNTRVQITDKVVQKQVHEMRSKHQAIITGINTVIIDDPLLTVRHKSVNNPAIIILDSLLKISLNSNVLIPATRAPLCNANLGVIVFTSEKGFSNTRKRKALENIGVKVYGVDSHLINKKTYLNLFQVLSILYKREVYSVMLEAGPRLASSFLTNNLVSKFTSYIAPTFLYEGIGLRKSEYSVNNIATRNNVSLVTKTAQSLYYTQTNILPQSHNIMISGYLYDIFKW